MKSMNTRTSTHIHTHTRTHTLSLCLRSGQNHLARHSKRGKKTRQTEEEVGRHHQGMDGPGVRQIPEGSGEQGKMEKTGCKIVCGAQATLAVEGLMMMMCVRACVSARVQVYMVCVCVRVCVCMCVLVRVYIDFISK